jgi:hypothetical protein
VTELQPIEVGDRFESKDKRDGGRIVEVVEERGLSGQGERQLELARQRYRGVSTTSWGTPVADALEDIRKRYTFFTIRTEVHPKNPSAVGRNVKVHEGTLRTKYRRVSR